MQKNLICYIVSDVGSYSYPGLASFAVCFFIKFWAIEQLYYFMQYTGKGTVGTVNLVDDSAVLSSQRGLYL